MDPWKCSVKGCPNTGGYKPIITGINIQLCRNCREFLRTEIELFKKNVENFHGKFNQIPENDGF